ncbi:MAG: histidine kinase [Bacteroidales bacterium]
MALFNEAIDSYFEALKLWEMKKDSAGLAIAYGSIGLMYYYQKDYKRALEFNFRKIPLTEKAGDIWELSKTYNNISQVYNSKNQYDSALIYLRKGLKLNLRVNYKPGIATAYNNMATALLLKSETDSADLYVRKAVVIAGEINDPELANYLTTLGHVYKAKGEYNSAIESTLSGHRLATEKKDPVGIYQASALLSDLYRLTGRKDMAYDYLKEYMTLKDSINNDRFLKRIARLEIQNEYDRKQKAAELEQIQERLRHETRIKQQKIYLNGLLLLLLLLAIISVLYIRQSRFKLKYTRMDLEQRLLRAQMNPHFIFNSLCAIQDLIVSGKHSRANTFLTKIAKLMRNILENSSQEFIPLEKEIETLKLYLDIQKLRFEKEFEYSFDVDKAIDTDNISVPPMLAQPCVENSIEHGLLPDGKRGNIHIRYLLDNGLLTLEVTDDGVGRDHSALRKEKIPGRKSLSTSLTEKRLEHFRFALKERDISYTIIDLYEGKEPSGTKVIMRLPYRRIFD